VIPPAALCWKKRFLVCACLATLRGVAAENLSITGLWHGQFSYPRALPPEFFTATLQDEPGWLTGCTTETYRGRPLCARLLGRRDGQSVAFTKDI